MNKQKNNQIKEKITFEKKNKLIHDTVHGLEPKFPPLFIFGKTKQNKSIYTLTLICVI